VNEKRCETCIHRREHRNDEQAALGFGHCEFGTSNEEWSEMDVCDSWESYQPRDEKEGAK
jgi:hypothetical protein